MIGSLREAVYKSTTNGVTASIMDISKDCYQVVAVYHLEVMWASLILLLA
jgi:hypothetical protein